MADISTSTALLPEEFMEKFRWLDEHLRNQPATVKEFQPAWQAYKYLVGGKMYAYIGMNDKNGRPIVTMKLEPAFSEIMRGEYADVVPGYYMNKEHWSSVYLDGEVPRDVIADMACASYRLMFSLLSAKARREIEAEYH